MDPPRIFTPQGAAPEPAAVAQLRRCLEHPSAVRGALMADHHKGYSMPIGGVVAYDGMLSPSGVGFDIGCGNEAVLTDLAERDVRGDLPGLMDAITSRISFGVGRSSDDPDAREHPVHDDPAWDDLPDWVRALRPMARDQLGTVGGGNHYVNLMADEAGRVWVCNHFGSRGLGHRIATGFLNLAGGDPPDARFQDDMDAPPRLIPARSELGAAYDAASRLAARYALVGRRHVNDVVLGILGAAARERVNVHHNDYWHEEGMLVVRKGATPMRHGERAYIGGSMTDGAAIVEAVGGAEGHADSLASAPHGAGRVMSRSRAKGNRKGTRPGEISPAMMFSAVRDAGVELRGGDVDESPFVYRHLDPVLAGHAYLRVVHRLRPLGVAMAPSGVADPYKD